VERRFILKTLLQKLRGAQETNWRLFDDPASPRLGSPPVRPAGGGGSDHRLVTRRRADSQRRREWRGRPEYSVSRRGSPVILPSRLGFLLTDAPKLERNFAIAEAGRRSVDTRWEQPWGERRFVRDRHNELRVA
jgi:hypothetical protein